MTFEVLYLILLATVLIIGGLLYVTTRQKDGQPRFGFVLAQPNEAQCASGTHGRPRNSILKIIERTSITLVICLVALWVMGII